MYDHNTIEVANSHGADQTAMMHSLINAIAACKMALRYFSNDMAHDIDTLSV